MKKNNKKGFTLAELLIVVAIIGVLVAISIPIFTAQLEKAREATDLANIRAAYAEVVSAKLTDESATPTATVELKQQKDGWETANPEVAGAVLPDTVAVAGDSVVITFDADGDVTIGGVKTKGSALNSSTPSGD